jgi:glycopeptide antibiotics resistance protein
MNTSGRQGDPTAHWRRRAAVVLLAVCVAAVLLITLFPMAPSLDFLTPLSDSLTRVGVPPAYAGTVLEAILNVLMFVPLGFLIVFLLPSVRLWWVAIVAASAVSFAVELVQGVALSGRSATVIDFVANSTGGAVGAVVALIWLRARERRGGGSVAVPPESGHRSR